MSEAVKVGDKVRVGPGMRVRSLQSRQGEVLTVTRLSSGNAFWADDADGETYALYASEVELVIDTQTIEVGDTVKATHTDGTTVQGVVDDTDGYQFVEIIEISFYTAKGWTFEVVSKEVKPPKVGDVVKDADSLPVGTLVKTNEEGASILRTHEGWIDQYDYKFFDAKSLHNETTIVYLPEAADVPF